MKICNDCKEEKDEEEFTWRHKSRGVRQAICKGCQKIRRRLHYLTNSEYEIKRNSAYRRKQSDRLQEYKSTLSCIMCGESENCCLDFHHINPSTKIDAVQKMARRNMKWEKVQQEIDKCVVLCSNCHRKIHAGKLALVI